jgi:Leucine-rich repeat (LRR) protein
MSDNNNNETKTYQEVIELQELKKLADHKGLIELTKELQEEKLLWERTDVYGFNRNLKLIHDHPRVVGKDGKIVALNFTWYDLDQLPNALNKANFPHLEALSLYGCGLEKIDLSHLTDFSDLKHLILNYNKLTAIDLSPLIGLTELQTFSLWGNNIEEIDLEPLGKVSNLISFSLRQIHFN